MMDFRVPENEGHLLVRDRWDLVSSENAHGVARVVVPVITATE